MSMIRLIDVTKTYNSGPVPLTVLKGINIEIPEARTTVITGASGSGKSTLLNLIGGLDRVTSGQIHAAGLPIHSMSEAELTHYRSEKLGFIFQFHYLLKEFTAVENAMLPAFMAGVPRTDAIECAMALLGEVHLTDRADHFPSQLSGGERQRVALARALINQPDILLADEPTGNLDADNSAGVEEILLSLVRNHGTTLVLVTHDERLGSRGDLRFHLDHGELVPS
jgi:lipoprotein-releasing system ATP-binding protein